MILAVLIRYKEIGYSNKTKKRDSEITNHRGAAISARKKNG